MLFIMRRAIRVTLHLHQILRLPRKITLIINPWNICSVVYIARNNRSHNPTLPNTAPAMKIWIQDFSGKSWNCFCRYKDGSRIIRWQNRHLAPAASETLLVPSWRRILYWKIQYYALRLSINISRNAAPAAKSNTPPSSNTAPATKNDAHDWSLWHMQRRLHCAQQQESQSNFTKYCACHEILNSRFQRKILELLPPK